MVRGREDTPVLVDLCRGVQKLASLDYSMSPMIMIEHKLKSTLGTMKIQTIHVELSENCTSWKALENCVARIRDKTLSWKDFLWGKRRSWFSMQSVQKSLPQYMCIIHVNQSEGKHKLNLEEMIFFKLCQKAYFCYHSYNIHDLWTIGQTSPMHCNGNIGDHTNRVNSYGCWLGVNKW